MVIVIIVVTVVAVVVVLLLLLFIWEWNYRLMILIILVIIVIIVNNVVTVVVMAWCLIRGHDRLVHVEQQVIDNHGQLQLLITLVMTRRHCCCIRIIRCQGCRCC